MSGFGFDLLFLAFCVAAVVVGLRHAARLERNVQRWHEPVDLDELDFGRQGGAERRQR